MSTEQNHSLAELLGKLLLGIENVPPDSQRKMVRSAISGAVEWTNKEIRKLERRIEEAEWWLKDMNREVVTCPQCCSKIKNGSGHAKKCRLNAILIRVGLDWP